MASQMFEDLFAPLKENPGVSVNPIQLLIEWMEFWESSDDMPAKLPNSLHTRTIVALAKERYESK